MKKIVLNLTLTVLATIGMISISGCKKGNEQNKKSTSVYDTTDFRYYPFDHGWPFVLCLQSDGTCVAFQDSWEGYGQYAIISDNIQITFDSLLDVYTCPFLWDTIIPNIGNCRYENTEDSIFLTSANIKFEFVNKDAYTLNADSLYQNLPNENTYILVSYIK